jgi:hypothetical protein
VNLRALRAALPDLFYSGQTWFDREPFMDVEHDPTRPLAFPEFARAASANHESTVPAFLLALLYVHYPNNPIWSKYLWTSDFDRQGQRVFVGQNGHGFEIHRHLYVTERFGLPVWRKAA